MSNSTAALLALCLVLTACTSAVSNTTIESNVNAAAPIVFGKTHTLSSSATGQDHEVNVWLPPQSGDQGKTYPVLYVIDGGLDQDFPHIAGLAQLSTINKSFETPIVVGIRTSNRYYQLTPKMTDSRYLPWNGTPDKPEMGGADEFASFITKTVVPFIETTYPVNNTKTLMGESLAGFYVARMFLRQPDSFTDYVSVSPSLWLDDQRLAKEAGALLSRHADRSRGLYLTMADEGGTMQAGLDKLLDAVEKRALKNLNVVYVDRRNSERHSTIYHGAALDALVKLHGLPVPDYGPTPWYLIEGGVPRAEP